MRRRLLSIALCFCLSWGAQILLAIDVPPEVVSAATNGAQSFLRHVPPGENEFYGFSKDDDLTQASLGNPFRMYTIQPTSLWSDQLSATVTSLVSETTMWFFPVMLGTVARAMLVVDREAGRWKAVSLGYGSLAHELNSIWKQWPESQGFHPKLIAVFQAKRFYFTVPEVDDLNLTPIALPQRTSEVRVPQGVLPPYFTLGSLSNAVQNLRPVVRSAGAELIH
jgi:hypothetical protein